MSEEENKIKPKATLIKHVKVDTLPVPQTPAINLDPELVQEKKKTVVVIKKKPVLKKIVVVHKESNPTEATEKTKTVSEKPPVRNTPNPPNPEIDQSANRPIVKMPNPSNPDSHANASNFTQASRRTPDNAGRYNNPNVQSQDRSGYSGAPRSQPTGNSTYNRSTTPNSAPQRYGTTNYQGQRPNSGYTSNYGNRPPNSGYQGTNPRPGYTGQGSRPPSTGGGYQGNRPQGLPGRPGAPRPFTRSPGFSGGSGGRKPNTPPPIDLTKKSEPKKLRGVKKKEAYGKERQEQEKNFQYTSKKQLQKLNPVPKEIEIMEVVTIAELARKMNLKAADLIGKLMSMGMMVTQNEQIDAETASILSSEYGTTVKIISLYEETLLQSEVDKAEDLSPRSPIVTIMGHVDHGKTKLLDAIRTTNVAGGEHGGITQHIGAYQVKTEKGYITFLDTPGHEAFTLMRARGAQITDIVVLVVAANDGVMPQTLEAINHAKEAKVPIIVAINKVDLPEANPDRVRQQLSDHGLIPEAWGGTTMFCEISALKKLGLDNLLDVILLQAEVLELKANPEKRGEGKVIESKIDQGRGVVATVLIQTGTLRTGDNFIGGVFSGKVRAMFNDHGQLVKEATPSMPVEILGFDGMPSSGDPFQVTAVEKDAREISYKRQELKKVEEAKNVKKINLTNLYDHIKEGEIQELKVIIKGDVHGSVEALQQALEKLSTAEIRLSVIHASAGAITENDVYLGAASNAIIIGFHVRPNTKVIQVADREKVEIRKYNIIYDAVDDIKSAMEGMLSPELKEEASGSAEVRDTFKVPKIGVIAGCAITNGKIRRTSQLRVFRDGVQIFEGKISSLKRFKDDVKEVSEGYECGIGIDGFQDLKSGDIFEAYDVVKIAKKLGAPLKT